MKIFQYAVILNPTEKEAEEGIQAKLIVEVKTVLAADQNGAVVLAGRDIPAEYLDKLNRLEVAVRPF